MFYAFQSTISRIMCSLKRNMS